MRLTWLQKGEAAPNQVQVAPAPGADASQAELAGLFQQETSGLGLEAAKLKGVLEDTSAAAERQGTKLADLSQQLMAITSGQTLIQAHTDDSLQAVVNARAVVSQVGQEVSSLVCALHDVADAAQQIIRIALQTRLVAFNATVEAKRAGDAGRGFAVVADAIKDLAEQVEITSKSITTTVASLDEKARHLEADITRTPEQGHQDGLQAALQHVNVSVNQIREAAVHSTETSSGLSQLSAAMGQEVQRTLQTLQCSVTSSESVLKVSERLMEVVASCGVQTADTPYIELAQCTAAQLSHQLQQALDAGKISEADLFDEHYRPIAGSAPQQHLTAFNAVTDQCFPAIQESALKKLPGIVFCIGVDRNGYIPTHNQQYCKPQRDGDMVWNTANCRWRRIFNDRTGLASARNQRPFLLQTYRRDMGGGQFVMLKEASSPIVVNGRHWGGVRLAYKF